MKTKILSFLVLFTFVFLSCKKNEDNASVSLTSKTWKRTLVDKNTATNPSGSVMYYARQDCEKDDTFKFGEDAKLIINKGSSKCDASEAQTVTENYSFNATTKELVINGDKFTLAEISKTQLKYYTPLPPVSGNAQYLLYIFE